jgi:hypothetical protein
MLKSRSWQLRASQQTTTNKSTLQWHLLSAGGAIAVGASKLHHTTLTRRAGEGGVASRLLHGDGRNHNGRNVVGITILVELVKVRGTGGVRSLGAEVDVLELLDGDVRGVPAAVVDTAVEPPLLAIGEVGVGLRLTAGSGRVSRYTLSQLGSRHPVRPGSFPVVRPEARDSSASGFEYSPRERNGAGVLLGNGVRETEVSHRGGSRRGLGGKLAWIRVVVPGRLGGGAGSVTRSLVGGSRRSPGALSAALVLRNRLSGLRGRSRLVRSGSRRCGVGVGGLRTNAALATTSTRACSSPLSGGSTAEVLRVVDHTSANGAHVVGAGLGRGGEGDRREDGNQNSGGEHSS